MAGPEPVITRRLRIEGLVQGVGYRAFVEREAVNLGLDGWVRNRRDGGVEALVRGETSAVARLVERCRTGPRAGRVDMVRELDDAEPVGAGFEVRTTV